ncbi:MAG: iron-containing redox enzyme family protein [Nitrososphaerales archaeon]|nr:iron-containing redox enzyme family protein [Nitrososphaerales archaeon]
MNGLVKSIDAEIERRSLLKHPFYKMWSEGKLNLEHLAGYSKEYFQLVKAVPEMVKNIEAFVTDSSNRAVVSEILMEETQHVDLWAKFAGALGVSREILTSYPGTPKTNRSLSGLISLTKASFGEAVAAAYALESEQPTISRSKLDGLRRFYGMDSDDGTVYFRVHEEADVRHAAVWRDTLQDMNGGDEEKMLNAATTSLNTQNVMLDSVMENCEDLLHS